ncbi:hypothetical protein KGY73_10075 [bacterium]|nr:hypothetical protein [bacterium]
MPIDFIQYYYLPARQNLHNVFLFKVKNSDLGFAPPQTEESKEEGKTEQSSPSGNLEAQSHIFIQFNKMKNGQPGELVKEVYIPVEIKVDSESYQPDKKSLYSTGYPLPPGDYILSMAIASEDLEKIGTQYFEFSPPDPASFKNNLGTTPIFFVKNIERMSSPETKATVHKDFFTYSVLKITPNLKNRFKPGDMLDIFFYVFGAQPNSSKKYGIDIQFKVFKGDKLFIKYAPQSYEKAPIVSQPLPMKRTVLVKKKKGEEVVSEEKEKRDLEPGSYTLSAEIEDTISGKSLTKKVDFTVVGETEEEKEEKKEEKEKK